jgi:uncharacterized protein YcnI
MNALHPIASRARWLLAGASLIASAASAHVVLDYQAAPAGSSYRATFKIGHGCGESATRQVVVEIPAGVRGAHPMPRPGWQLAVERAALPQPETNHGRTVTDDVVRITWTARSREDMLASAHYDEFVLVARLPAQAGTLYWPGLRGGPQRLGRGTASRAEAVRPEITRRPARSAAHRRRRGAYPLNPENDP